MIFVVSGAFSQKNVTFLATQTISKSPVTLYSTAFSKFSANKPVSTPVYPIQANFYSTNLGFFCKQEIKFEKITKIPFRFRLGSVQQCDWLEGKRN
jgi:hypothetical protein